ncbi:MAG: pyruvate kinase [Terriglobales bacterium]|jgi:pyruvate kinase
MAIEGVSLPTEKPGHTHAAERRAKIVCTVGPASSSEAMLGELMRLGMDVARLNFSHGTHEEHARVIERLRRAAAKQERSICILQDLQGPKIRTGRLREGRPIALKTGSRVTITPRNVLGTPALIPTGFRGLAQEVETGSRVLLSDGLIELVVKAIHGDDMECVVVNGGMLGEHQGINLPGTALSVPSLTEKDRKDLEFGLRHAVDMIAISFVRTAADVRETKRLIGVREDDIPVIAKLEKPQAIEHLEEILEVADGVMVARGDLGVEMPPEQVPIIQKHIIRRAAEWRKPVITATQMLESMVDNPRPTRAEVSDVANAVFDGSDAVMLSAETASGKYPRESVEMMGRIVVEAEAHMREASLPQRRREHRRKLSISETICESVAHAAEELEMRAIAVYTETGTTARLVSKYRPKASIHAFAHRESVCNRLNLLWGVRPVACEHVRTAEEMVRRAERELMQQGAAGPGDVVAVISGTRGASGSTNLMRLHIVGEGQRLPERRRARAAAERNPEDPKR